MVIVSSLPINLMWFTLRPVAKWLLCCASSDGLRAFIKYTAWMCTYARIQLKRCLLYTLLIKRYVFVYHVWYTMNCVWQRTSKQADRLTCILFSVLPQICGSMNLGLGCVCRPVCWPFGSLLDSRHCVFAVTLLTLLMQVVVEANSWWYAIISLLSVFLFVSLSVLIGLLMSLLFGRGDRKLWKGVCFSAGNRTMVLKKNLRSLRDSLKCACSCKGSLLNHSCTTYEAIQHAYCGTLAFLNTFFLLIFILHILPNQNYEYYRKI